MLKDPGGGPALIRHAMVLAAGLGTRMRPLTKRCPKPLIEVADKALIDHTLDDLAKVAIEKAVVNVHYLADQLEQHLLAREATGRRPALAISDERTCLLETGGGLAKALPAFEDEPFICTNTDSILYDAEGQSGLSRLCKMWRNDHMDALLLLCRPEAASGHDGEGDFHLDREGRLSWPAGTGTGRSDDSRAERASLFIYTGFQIIHPRLLENAPPAPHSVKIYWDRAMAAGRLYGLIHEGAWLHVGDPKGLAAAQQFFQDP